MPYPIGKIRFEAKKANCVLLAGGESRIWVTPFFGPPFSIDASGVVQTPNQPPRSSIVWSGHGRVLCSSVDAVDGVDVVQLFTLSLAGEPIGAPIEIGRFEQGSGAYVAHIAASRSGSVVAVLVAHGGEQVAVEAWSPIEGRRLLSHRLERNVDSVRAVAASHDGKEILAVVEGIVHRWPIAGGEPVRGGGDAAFHAIASIGGARRLPVGPDGEVLVQALPSGLLALIDRSGALLFRHEAGPYAASEDRRSAMGLSPNGQNVVAAVGTSALSGVPTIAVYDRAGQCTRTIEHKCAKNEEVYDVALDDEGWIALATSHRAEIFAPPGVGKAAKKK